MERVQGLSRQAKHLLGPGNERGAVGDGARGGSRLKGRGHGRDELDAAIPAALRGVAIEGVVVVAVGNEVAWGGPRAGLAIVRVPAIASTGGQHTSVIENPGFMPRDKVPRVHARLAIIRSHNH